MPVVSGRHRIGFKDPDVCADIVDQVGKKAKKYFEFGEYGVIQIEVEESFNGEPFITNAKFVPVSKW